MTGRRGQVGSQRRQQIVDAATAIIAEVGIQKLSLSAIEERTGMSRGQSTYYFPTKEDILLAVFDHMIEMHRRDRGRCKEEGHGSPATGWERLTHFLRFFILDPPPAAEFHALQYTFLSQIGHRDDFRQRLANLYEEWRGLMAESLAAELERHAQAPGTSARTVASFVQALLHGIAMQRVADPDAFDAQEMLDLSLNVLGRILAPAEPPAPPPRPKKRRRPRPVERE